MRKLWNALRRPSARWSVLALVAIGIVIGIALIVLPHVGIKVTSTTEFCVSCHSMQPVYEEYKQSVHFQNASGVPDQFLLARSLNPDGFQEAGGMLNLH